MKKRYRVIYVGEDGRNHAVIVWAKDSSEARQKAKRREDVEFVMGVQRANGPVVFWLIVLGVILLVALSAVK